MNKTIFLRNESNLKNIIGDHSLEKQRFFYLNESKEIQKVYTIIITMKTYTKIEKLSYGVKIPLINGYNISYLTKNNKQLDFFDNDKPIKINEDLITYNFEINEFDSILNNHTNTLQKNYKFTKFVKKLNEPLQLFPGESIFINFNDDFTNFIEHKILLEIIV